MILGRLRKLMFGISVEETTVARRGFGVSNQDVGHYLEEIGRVFVLGYHAALMDPNPESLTEYLKEAVEIEYQGFAFEGAAMGLTLLDLLTPWTANRLQRLADGPGNEHYYMIHVGAGWALARLKRGVEGQLKRLDPVVGWLAVEGYGFHEGYFSWRDYIEKQAPPPKNLRGYACRVFDQGLGRSLWFVKGANVKRMAAIINAFPTSRQADLWSGVGLACGYAGGVNSDSIKALDTAAASYHPYLAQGVVFAAATRARAKNPVAHTELACQIVCNLSLHEAAQLANSARKNLPFDDPTQVRLEPAWEIWRQRVQAQFATQQELLNVDLDMEKLIQ